MSSPLHRLLNPSALPSRNNLSLILGTSITTLALVALTRLAFYSTPASRKTIPSPRDILLPRLGKEERDALPYPPDVFPGARDVGSPYGTIRVYEWGPLTGRKVLLIHGISTPCLSLGPIADALVSQNCRVMLLDLWGRGYSDGTDLPHDSRLYCTEILLAVSSSELQWMGGTGGFSLVGYSLGGGICVDFAASFGEGVVESLVLLAPSGQMRAKHFAWSSKLLYSGWIPDFLLERIIRRRLKGGASKTDGSKKSTDEKGTPEDAAKEEIRGTDEENFDNTLLSKNRPGVTVASAVQWQLEHNEGFVKSFISSFKFATIEGNKKSKEYWRRTLGVRKDRVIVFAGSTDPIIVADELLEDWQETIGAEKLEWRVIEGGHEFPITCSEEVVKELVGIWGT